MKSELGIANDEIYQLKADLRRLKRNVKEACEMLDSVCEHCKDVTFLKDKINILVIHYKDGLTMTERYLSED